MQLQEHLVEDTLEKHLKFFFGYNEFRHSQREIVTAVLKGNDVVAILPTGAGKSICYQLPALLMPGVTIVVSPLISLMQDQVISLTKNGLPAAFLNSSLRYEDIMSVMANVNAYKLLYVAPERLNDPIFLERLEKAQVSLFAIDEAHCISQWGHSFRPEYRQLSFLKKKFPAVPIIALTATATISVESDIVNQLELQSPYIVRASFDRPNLTLRICEKASPLSQLSEFLEQNQGKSGIIYAGTRKTVDSTWEYLQNKGIKVGKYHAGMPDKERSQAQYDFVHDKHELIVATVAFGMGINKPDVRFIVHMDMPSSIEQYYQEIGRAGRDGLSAECLMLFSAQELILYDFFLEKIPEEAERRACKARTNKIYSLCRSSVCRRKELLYYFGESYLSPNCKGCDNCLDDAEMIDATIAAQKILSCVYRLQQRFGLKHVMEVLRGSRSKSVIEKGHDNLSTYGLMKEYEEPELRQLIECLIEKGYLMRSVGEYPVLQWTEKSSNVTGGIEKISLRKKIMQEVISKPLEPTNYDTELFTQLSQLRREISAEANVPAFVVFGDRTLVEMATYYPLTQVAFMELNGVGPIKWERYGQVFLDVIIKYCSRKNINPGARPVNAPFKSSTFSGSDRRASALQTLTLYRQGLMPQDIAENRGLSITTILDHLSEQIVLGCDIDISPIVSHERQETIQEAIAKAGFQKLAPVKQALPEDYTYEEIRLVAAFFRRPYEAGKK